jgi:hypothetical protein
MSDTNTAAVEEPASSLELAKKDLTAFATHYMQCDEEGRKYLFTMLIDMSSNLY